MPSLPKWLIIHLKKKGPQISHYHNVLTVFSDSDKEAVGGEHLPFSLHLDIGLGVYSHKRECVMKRNGNKQITIPKGRKKKIPQITLSQSSIYTSTFWENHSKTCY